MENKKGFTLVELLAVIIILGVVMLIAVPSVSRYVLNSKDTTYDTYLDTMKQAAKDYMIECLSENKENCSIPSPGDSTMLYVNDLVSQGYMESLRDPEGDGNCDASKSYVIVQSDAENETNYKYQACLYCSRYKSPKEECIEYNSEGNPPVCGVVKGEGSLWTNENRTITVQCKPGDSDAISACSKDEFSKTFTGTTDQGEINIQSRNGMTTACKVSVKIDKEVPTCKLKITSAQDQGLDGWYSSDTKVEFDGMNDSGGSGIQSYGIGTSRNKREYNKKTVYEVGNGITTVYGFVRDYAGNEGYCAIEVKTDKDSPEQTVSYGYQIYPNKEKATLSGLNVSGTKYTTTNSDPIIDITGLTEYRAVTSVIVHFAAATTKQMNGQVFYKTTGATYNETSSVRRTIPAGSTKMEFPIPRGTYEGVRVDLGDVAGLSYDINRIELVVGDRSILYTNKNVTVYVQDYDSTTGVYEISYDNGLSWIPDRQKVYSGNTTFKVIVKDRAGNVSKPTTVEINNIDKINPNCTLTVAGTLPSGSPWYTTNVTVSFASATDTGGSTVRTYGIGSDTGQHSIIHSTDSPSGVSYTGYIRDRAGNTNTCTTSFKRKANYTVTYNNMGGGGCNTLAVVYGKPYGNLCQPTRTGYTFKGWYKETSYSNAVNNNTTVTNYDNHTLYAKWQANTFVVTYAGNGANSGSMETTTCTYDQNCYLAGIGYGRTGYTFQGWSTSAGGGVVYGNGANVINAKTSGTLALYAVWTPNTFTVTYHGNGSNGGGMGVTTCTYDRDCYLAGIGFSKTYYSFTGWATYAGGGAVYGNEANVRNVRTSGNIDLYATWQQNSVTITYQPNGGNGSAYTQSCLQGSSCTLTGNNFSRENYNYLGWSTTSGGVVTHSNGGTYTFTGNTNLYAVWELALVNKCRYRTHNHNCQPNCHSGSCCERNAKNNYCISYTDCHCSGETCEWTAWSGWSTEYTSVKAENDKVDVECQLMTP